MCSDLTTTREAGLGARRSYGPAVVQDAIRRQAQSGFDSLRGRLPNLAEKNKTDNNKALQIHLNKFNTIIIETKNRINDQKLQIKADALFIKAKDQNMDAETLSNELSKIVSGNADLIKQSPEIQKNILDHISAYVEKVKDFDTLEQLDKQLQKLDFAPLENGINEIRNRIKIQRNQIIRGLKEVSILKTLKSKRKVKHVSYIFILPKISKILDLEN